MKLVRYRSATGEKPGLILDGEVFDLSGSVAALHPRAPTFADIAAIAAVPAHALLKVPKGAVLGPPLRGIGKIIGVGLNYRDHATETGLLASGGRGLDLPAALCPNGGHGEVDRYGGAE